MKKKLLLTLLMMLFSIMALVNVSVAAETYGNLTYEISNGKITITDCDESARGEMVIPDTINRYPVTSIGIYAFSYCTGLTNITIPDSVTSISAYAFQNCTKLTSVIIPDSVTSIDAWAFYNCTGLKSITIPNSVTNIYMYAFLNCTGLKSIIIPDSVTRIVNGTFENCTELTSVTIPDSVTSINDRAFYKCTSLTDVYYSGTEEDWNNISIDSGNVPLLNATIHFESNGTSEEPACTPGDVNADSEVDIQDVMLVRRYVTGGYGVELK